MVIVKIGHLIDMAIGIPDASVVNFSALHCLLTCMAEKLGITDEMINYDQIEAETKLSCNQLTKRELLQRSRLIGGHNPNENNVNESPPSEEIQMENNESATEQLQVTDGAEVNEPMPKTPDEEVFEEEPSVVTEHTVVSPKPSESWHLSLHGLAESTSKIETAVQNISIPHELSSGISIMKDQLEFVIEQILLLTFLTLSKRPDRKQNQQLHAMAQALLDLKKENIFIKGFKENQIPLAPALNWASSDLQLNDDLSENIELEDHNIVSAHDINEAQSISEDELEDHLCYSPAKLLDQLMDLKSQFCILTNKVNEISSRLLHQESQRLISLIQELQDQMQNIKLANVEMKQNQGAMDLRLQNNRNSIESIKSSVDNMLEKMVDKTDFEAQLANKVDFNQLQRKASLDQILELQCRIDKKFCEMLKRINESDAKSTNIVENFKTSLGFSAIEEVLAKFKESITKDIQSLNELFRNHIESTNDDCAGAGTRIKVLHDLACLSCDTNCVMRTTEKQKVAKLPSAHASNIISPLVTYELSSLRKSGLMGYYRKDEFPHAPNAWLAQQSNALTNLKQCVPRHAGGHHTTNSAKELLQKKMLVKK